MRVSKRLKWGLSAVFLMTGFITQGLAVHMAHALPVAPEWVQQYTPDPNTHAGSNSRTASDGVGNVYVLSDMQSTSNAYSVSVIKYDSSGNRLWADSPIAPQGYTRISGIAVDAGGNPYVAIQASPGMVTIKYDTNGNKLWQTGYSGVVERGLGAAAPKTIHVTASGNVYVLANVDAGFATIKYDASGNQLWEQTYAGSNNFGVALAVDANDNAYATGYGPGAPNTGITVVKYGASGTEVWTATYAVANHNVVVADLFVDTAQNTYITGYDDNLTGQGSQSFITVKFNASGAEQWAKNYSTAGANNGANAVKADASGNVYVTGTSSNSGWTAKTIKYDAQGNQLWDRSYSYSSQAQGTVLLLDAVANVYIGGPGYANTGDGYRYDFILVGYDTNGTERLTAFLNGGGLDILRDITRGSAGDIFATGFSCDTNFQSCTSATAKFTKPDTTPPVVTGAPDRQPNGYGWYNGPVTLTWMAVDAGGTATTPSPTIANADGANVAYISGPSCDPSNNCATGSYSLSIDKTLPTISHTSAPAANSFGWNKSNVTINFSCADALSGIASCPPATAVTTETSGQTVTGMAVDKADNTATTSTIIKLDKTLPTASAATMSSRLFFGASTTTVSATATDALSGVAAGEYYIDTDPGLGNGSPLTYVNGKITGTATIPGNLGFGQHRLYMRSVDKAGNWSTSVSVTFIFV